MGVALILENTIEPIEVIEDFGEVVHKINFNASQGMTFMTLNKTDGRPVAFSIPNLVCVESRD